MSVMLHHLRRDREVITTEIGSRIVDDLRKGGRGGLLEVVGDTLYKERERIRRHSHLYKHPERDAAFFRKLSRNLGTLSEAQLVEVLEKLVRHYVDEVIGYFDPWMYRLATVMVPSGLSFMLNTISPFRILKNFPEIPSIDGTVVVSGSVEKLRRLKRGGGVMMYVPEHQSNLDSPVMGYGIYKAALPPVMYGAGLNLFQMPVFPHFMGRLGAYTVDRLKTADLYKRILKEYAAVTLELGYDHLFFPGGTRSRSGKVESRLKKGLLGTALKALVSSRLRGKDAKFYIVPVTVSYHVVLEAPTLIEDHLKGTGKSRYIIIDDESSRPAVIFNFASRLLALEGRIFLHFSEPLDPFGNAVDEEGRSLDRRGRIIDTDGYLRRNGTIAVDEQRDQVYTNHLERGIVSSYFADTVILSTHVAAFALFKGLRKKSATPDLFKFLREEALHCSIPLDEAGKAVDGIIRTLVRTEREGKQRLDPAVKSRSGLDVILNAAKYFGIFHRSPVILRRGNRLFTEDPNLLFYYHNRLASYDREVRR